MRRTVRTATVPAPVGGVNARDSIVGQKKEDAVHMSNWWPSASNVMVRKGYAQHTTAVGAVARRLMAYRTATGADKLFYSVGNNIYDGTTAGAHTTAVVTGLSGGDFQHANFSNSGGTYLFVVNGADTARTYNGTAWAEPSITTVTSDNFSNVTVHKDRLWFVMKNSLKLAYLGSKAIAGDAAEFDVRSMCKEGGYLVAVTTWTLDAGAGMDDHLVAITSEGECLVYAGTDPTDSSLWSIVGVWQLSKPVSKKCFTKFGGDVVYFGREGATLLSKALASSQVSSGNTLTDRIRPLISADWARFGSVDGWSVSTYPQESMLILNVPETESISHQWVMNTITGAWTKFDGINAFSFEAFDDGLYFSTSDLLCQFWVGYTDYPSAGAQLIRADALQSFQSFGGTTTQKRFTLVRPNMISTGQPGIWMQVNADYDPSAPQYTPTYSGIQDEALWGTAIWGNFRWAGGRYQLLDWQHTGAVGMSAALWMRVVSQDIETRWAATDYQFEPGGTI